MRNKRTKGWEGHRPSHPFCCSRTVIATGASRPWRSVLFCLRRPLFFQQRKRAFRAPARGTFAPAGKSTQTRRSNLRFENPLRGFTGCLSCLFSPRERRAVQISPKCCIVSASLFAVAFALKCRAVQPCYLWQDCFYKWRPKAATYLCREAAKARFDNRTNHRVGFPKGRGGDPSLVVVSREKDF